MVTNQNIEMNYSLLINKLFFKKIFYLISLFLTIFLPHEAFSANQNKEFIIGVEAVNYYPLISFSVNDDTKESYTKELLSRFFESKNYAYRFLPLPIKRFDKWYVEENIDFKYPDNPRWRTKIDDLLKIVFSEPTIKLIAGSYVLPKNELLTKSEIKKIGTILGFIPTLWLDEVASGDVNLIEESSPLGIVKHLLYGNIDATNIDANVIRHNLALLGQPNKIILNKKIKHQVFSYQLSTMKYPHIIEEFNHFMKNNKQFIDMIKRKYDIDEGFDKQ